MKYKTFRALAVAGLVVLSAGGIFLLARGCGGGDDEQQETASRPPRPETARQEVPPLRPAMPTPPGDQRGQPLRDLDTRLIALAGKPLAGGKGKDALGGAAKVNLYQDSGKALPNRAKVDLDRDDRWDEKWTFADGEVKRQVAPADDEQYTEEYQLVGERWLTAAELAAPPAPEPVAPVPPPTPPPSGGEDAGEVTAMHQALLDLAVQPLPGGKGKDVFSGRPYKVNLYQDAGKDLPNRAKIDVDRDDRWDEKWDFEGPAPDRKVKRHVAPADDEQYTLEYRLNAGKWVKK